MRKVNIKKALCILLIISMGFSLFACEEKTEEPYIKGQHVEIVQEKIEYSDTTLQREKERFIKIAITFIEKYYNTTLKDDKRQKISDNASQEFNKTIIPMLYRVRIYENELSQLFDSMEDYVNLSSTISMVSIYELLIKNVGSTRSGKIAFELSTVAINERAEAAQKNYGKYEYAHYKEEAERCTNIYNGLLAMGEGRFVDAISMITFFYSLSKSTQAKGEDNAFALKDAELLRILSHQGDCFADIDISEDEWSVIGALFSEFIPTSYYNTKSEMLYILKTEHYFTEAMKIMPEVAAFYASVAKAMDDRGEFSLNDEGEYQISAIIRAVVDSEEAFFALTTSIEEHATTSTKKQEDEVIKKAYTEYEILSFSTDYAAISSQELFAGFKNMADQEDINTHDIKKLIVSYLYSVAPHVTMVNFTEPQSSERASAEIIAE